MRGFHHLEPRSRRGVSRVSRRVDRVDPHCSLRRLHHQSCGKRFGCANTLALLPGLIRSVVILALVGGILGITLGNGATVGVAQFADWPIVVQPEIVALAFAVAAGVGIFFGYYPALKASRLDPIDALRYE